MIKNLISAHNLSKAIKDAEILKDIGLNISNGESVALTGPSGAGKTTLLQILGLLDKATSGKLSLMGINVDKFGEKKRTYIRRHTIGFIYQFHHLLPNFNAIENVSMPLLIQGKDKKFAFSKSEKLLTEIGLGKRLTHRVHQLSGGEQQRVAIARALIHNPQILLADEPTGNLDTKNSVLIFELMMELVRKRTMCTIIATHNDNLASTLDRTIQIKDGRLV